MNAEMTPRDEVMHKIMAAQQLLSDAKQVAVQANPLASSVPEINRLDTLGKELGDIMRAVARMQL